MKISKNKIELLMARRCVRSHEFQDKGIVGKATLSDAYKGKEILPATVGRIAKFLEVDVTDILAD